MDANFRATITESYNRYPHDKKLFFADVRRRGREFGFGPATILFLLKLALFLWQLWNSLQYRFAPVSPVPGEEDFREVPPTE